MLRSAAWTSFVMVAMALWVASSSCTVQSGTPGPSGGGGQDHAGTGGGQAGAGGGGLPDDRDGDGVADGEDNCPDDHNPSQWDSDADGEGDACEEQDGTVEHPFIIPGDPVLPDYTDSRDTHDAPSDQFDAYPGYEGIDESGPEFVYLARFEERMIVRARIAAPEPDGTDIDLHLLSALDPLTVVERGNHQVAAVVEPGRYYLILDTYVSDGTPQLGPYELEVALEAWHEGTLDDPLLPGEHPSEALALPFAYRDARDTTDAVSDAFDSYPGYEHIDESGPEFVYRFTVDEPARLAATIAFEEPAGTDIDLHLLSELDPPALVVRGDKAIYALIEPGTHYLILDTYVDGGEAQTGPYELSLSIRARALDASPHFNDYVLAAVDYLYAEYRLLGYGSHVLTHDVPYGDYGVIEATGGTLTMCVAAAMEVILTAMNIWAEDTADETVFDFLPIESWETLHSDHIKAHIWVNHDLDSYGTADALSHFGMGENVPFEELGPGSFLNLNRTGGTGHAVVFLAFLDEQGREYAEWNPEVIGFKYFSSQTGGLDFRCAIFDEHDSPPMPGCARDLHVIYSTDQHWLNTGLAWSPAHWVAMDYRPPPEARPSRFDPYYFDGVTPDR